MRVYVQARANAKTEQVQAVDPPAGRSGTYLKISVTAVPVAGRANRAIAKALAEYFSVAVGRVKIRSGQSAKMKVFEIT